MLSGLYVRLYNIIQEARGAVRSRYTHNNVDYIYTLLNEYYNENIRYSILIIKMDLREGLRCW